MSERLKKAAAQIAKIQEARSAARKARGEPAFRIWSVNEIMAHQEDLYFEIDKEQGAVHVYWGGYDYEFDLTEVKAPLDLLRWLHHLGDKGWELMDGEQVAAFVDAIAKVRGWDIHGGEIIAPRSNSHTAERAKLDRNLRYRVFHRDDFRCRLCGGSAATGAVLHIDHIAPISKGGRTEINNLQTLCAACNYGKGTGE